VKLSDLLIFDPILVQCHDNPDADAIASGYALYVYFKEMGKNVRFVYGGNKPITKANLSLLVDYLGINSIIEHVSDVESFLREYEADCNGEKAFPGLVVTADCQYGAGNVTRIPAKYVAIIDHHQEEISDVELSEIMSELGSCSTLVWKMLREEKFQINSIKLSTALYFGLYTDTNSMSEVFNPFDKDMRDLIQYEKSVIHFLKNSNFSLDEFEIAGHAMNRCKYNGEHRFAFIKSEQCDPNILGLISDFLLQVAEVDICVVYNEWPAGYKFSTRSCVKEVHADDLAAFLAEGIGSGGGHQEKAGGFIRRNAYEEKYGDMPTDDFFAKRMEEYYDSYLVIYAGDYKVDLSEYKKYVKKPVPRGYVMAKDILPVGTPVLIRTLEGDSELTIEENLVIMIGIKGEVYPSEFTKFDRMYNVLEEKYIDYEGIPKPDYLPTVINRLDNSVVEIADKARICVADGGSYIYAKPSDRKLKVFTQWNKDNYYAGKEGDYIAVSCSDYDDIYIVEKDIFAASYEEIEG